ncbi:MAG: glycosyltransferase family 9 protein [Chitinispirillaceae bacterium]|nr:glycosyltransferase family 9 protein [Chitinispirillaceae bacterium]
MHTVPVLLARRLVKNRLRSVSRTIKRRRLARLRAFAVIIAGGMGDGIMALPALVFLRKMLPGASIDVFVPQGHLAILSRLLQPFSLQSDSLAPLIAAAARHRRYDAVVTTVVAAFRVSAEIKARLAGRFCAGFRYPGEAPTDRLYDYSLPLSESEHDIDQNLALVAGAIGVSPETADARYPAAVPAGNGTHAPRRSVLVHPGAGSGYPHKEWPIERYREIIEQLVQRECSVTVLLGPDEAHRYASFSSIHGCSICVSHGPETLIAAIRAHRLFIGNDSGPAHCASLLGVPTVTLFGPTSAARTAPRGGNDITIESDMPCAPCHFTRAPCKDNKCLKSLSTSRVLTAIEKLLERGGA